MDSKFNIDSKISADAISHGTSNLNSNVTNANPILFKDQKRVIKKMIVMDTSKLKGLGIESTIKNAMSKLGKDNLKKPSQSIFKPVNVQPTHASSKPVVETVIKTEFEPKIVFTPTAEPMDMDTKPIVYRPGVPFTPTSLMTEQVPVQPTSVPTTTHQVVHLIRPSHPSADHQQTVTPTTPQVPVMINVVQSTSVPVGPIHRIQPMIISSTSTIPTVKSQNGPIETNCGSKMIQSQITNSPLIKTESGVPSASDGKKIKILSDVSLNDTKTKLLEIDKLSSKNLKFTTVIKGTDKGSSKSTVYPSPDSGVNPQFSPRPRPSVPSKVEIDKMSNSKFTNVIQRSEESQSQSPSRSVPSVGTTSKPSKSEAKVASSGNMNNLNVNDGIDLNSSKSTFTNQPVASSNASPIPSKIASKYLKQPPRIFNSSNEGVTPKQPFLKLPVRPPSYTTSKPSATGIDNIPSNRNVIFTNASKPPTVYYTSFTSKPATPSATTRTESNESNAPHYKVHYKGTKEPVHKIGQPVITSTCPTTTATDNNSTKQFATTDENFEIIIPSRQKYLSKRDKSGMTERTPICDPTKPFQDVLWATNNPRTYARHNVKRLLSDKIIKKTLVQEGNAQNDKIESKCDAEAHMSPSVECAVKPENVSVLSECEPSQVSQATTSLTTIEPEEAPVQENVNSVLSECEPICSQANTSLTTIEPEDAPLQPTDVNKFSGIVLKNEFYGFSVEDVNASASVLNQLRAILSKQRSMETPKIEHENVEETEEIKTVDCDSWILNYETGLLEEKANNNVPVALVAPTTEQQANANLEKTSTKQISPIDHQVLDDKTKIRLNSTTCDDSALPSQMLVIEDADDEISDIDLVHRSKAKCTGNALTPTVKNRRAILKSIELHRKAFMPATTDDDESERSLCVRPPRPKLRKLRQRQTVEQLNSQQSAHVNLLKRFTQIDADDDNLNDESLVYFVDGIEDRIKVLEDQVNCCFNPQSHGENVKLKEQIVYPPHTDSVTDKIESVKSSEIVTDSDRIVRPSESLSSVNNSLNCVVTAEAPSHQPTSHADSVEGQSMVHEVTIQKDTFLVTEYNDPNDPSDKIDHLPLNVKREKETSPQSSCSIKRSSDKKHTKSTIRKKRKRKSLVQMLAQHIDQDTLKSVIIAHANQKCDFSSSPDSDSDNGERSDEASDVVNKIFRTVCTIDLCDDDDETLHEDVLQYLKYSEENQVENVQHKSETSMGNKLKLSEVTPSKTKIKSETFSTDPASSSRNSIENEKVDSLMENVPSNSTNEPDNTAKESINVPDSPLSDPRNEMPSPSPPTISNISVAETETNNFIPLDDVEKIPTALSDELPNSPTTMDNISKLDDDDTKEAETAIDVEFSEASKSDEIQDAAVAKEPDSVIDEEAKTDVPKSDHSKSTVEEPEGIVSNVPKDNTSELNHSEDTSVPSESDEKTVLKLRPFEEISTRSKVDDNESAMDKKLSLVESSIEANSVISKKSKSRRKAKASKSKRKEKKNEIESKDPETSSEPTQQPMSNEKIQFSSVSVDDDSGVGAIKIKIKMEKDSEAPKSPISNGAVKSSRSRKRKSEVLEVSASSVAITTPIPSVTERKRKRPIFDYFDAPEILTTKRTRNSKSYVDDDNRNEVAPSKTPSTNQRTPRRKSTMSKSGEEIVVPKSESKARKNVEKAKNQSDTLPTEPVEPVAEQNVEENVATELKPVKSGRGIRPPVLAPLNVADKYVCGNCKTEVTAKNWTKHMKTHYGLAWRVNVDPPIDMDNIHTMSSKVFNFIKKANIKFLKCQKCGVEKKSALGYLSHLEVCGLTQEEIKSKLVKCEYCPSMIRSCSMKIHLTFCGGLKRLLQKENEETKEAEEGIPEECFNEAGRTVRRSAQKAMSSFKDLGKPPEAKVEDYVERVQKVSYKQQRKWRQLLKDSSIECVRNGCEFTTDNLSAMTNHFNTCVLVDGETFYCNRCDHGPDTRAAIEEHIKANHSLGVIEAIDDKDFSDSDDEAEVGEESSESEGESGEEEMSDRGDEECNYDDEDDDGWNTKGYKKKRIRDWGHNEVMLNSCLDRKVLAEHSQLLKTFSSGTYFQPALEWTHDFRDTHFSSNHLLPFATPNTFSILNSTMIDLYLPRITKSNKFLVKDVRKYKKQFGATEVNKSDEWKLLKRFEATKDNCSIVLFTGGPILSMAWLPVPDDHLSQILAVCCRNDANDDILLNNTKPTKCLIQIWNFDNLKNGQLRQAQIPNLLYSIAYDHGPVIQMEFCPSGGFTEDRLGLLAVSSCDGHVDILALPKNFTCDNSTIENLVFRIEPSVTLSCEVDEPLGILMTKLVWSQSMGHTKLAGGFSNGLVAIWNLKNLETPYICRRVNGIATLLPTDLFYAGNKTIKLLEFHHDEKKEARWLIAGSHDRKVKFFDTHNVYLEISTTVAHSRIMAGCWPIHWSTFLVGIDNAYSLKVSGIVVKQPLDIGCRSVTFYSIIGSTCDISFNNWLNTYAFVTSYGDIHVGYVRQMISGFCETRRQRSILGYTDSVSIGNRSNSENSTDCDERVASGEQQPSTSSAFEQTGDISYPSADGVIFCDFQNPLPAVTSPSYDKIQGPPMSAYNMVKVNRILFNPNVSAYKLYALGYEAGFVRIIQLMPK